MKTKNLEVVRQERTGLYMICIDHLIEEMFYDGSTGGREDMELAYFTGAHRSITVARGIARLSSDCEERSEEFSRARNVQQGHDHCQLLMNFEDSNLSN